MNPLGVWTLVIILYQTVICVIISWFTLGCKLEPSRTELHEVTLIKLLYLYDPDACGRLQFFNYTVMGTTNVQISTIVWPIKNSIAASFRSKIRLWLSLHVTWSLLAVINLMQGRRTCCFYVALLPFTCTGLAMLVVDLVHGAMFIGDIPRTATEQHILEYIQHGDGRLRWIAKRYRWRVYPHLDAQHFADTSWIAILLAYASCRGLVQWIINFWLVKDNYFEGLSVYRRLRSEKSSSKRKI